MCGCTKEEKRPMPLFLRLIARTVCALRVTTIFFCVDLVPECSAESFRGLMAPMAIPFPRAFFVSSFFHSLLTIWSSQNFRNMAMSLTMLVVLCSKLAVSKTSNVLMAASCSSSITVLTSGAEQKTNVSIKAVGQSSRSNTYHFACHSVRC